MAETITFDHYTVLTRDDGSLYELGRGAMGITYKAFDTNLRIPVALKVINSTFLNSDVARQRFVREARAAAKLRHRHVASVFHLAAEGETMFYAMEFVDGETVDALIKRQGPLAPMLALQIVDQVARALNAAQVHGLVHRDIKPANLMLIHEDDELNVKVIDFGLAKVMTPGAEDAATLSVGGFVGTPHFASPEQLEEREIDVRSDIYSLGVTLWYMLAGQTPFAGSMAQVMSQHLAKAPPFEKLANVPAAVAALLRRMLEKDRAKRPQTPSELRLEIEKAMAQVRAAGPLDPLAATADPEDYTTVLEDSTTRPGETKFDVGTVVAERYRIITRLGDTNTGVVFRAERTEDGKPVRLLVLHRELAVDPATATQIEREVEKAAPVEHLNLLRVYGMETIEGGSFITVEWTEGFSLLEVLRARRELEAVEVLMLLGQAAEGVDHALASGINRFDLALHQIFIHFSEPFDKHTLLHQPVTQWPEFVLKLNPLGVTRELSASETWSGQQTMVGRPGSSTAATSDSARAMQGLGGVVYELLGGTLSPLGSSTDHGGRYTPLANLSEQGNEALRHALAPVPRYKKACDFHRALAELDAEVVESVVRPRQAIPPVAPLTAPAPEATASPAPPVPAPQARPPVSPIPPPVRPERQPVRTGPPLAIAAMVVALILSFGGIYFYVLPLFQKAKVDPIDLIATPPPVAKKQEPLPPVPPSENVMLQAAASAAQTFEKQEDWPSAITQWTEVAQRFPESKVGKARLEILIQSLLRRSPEINAREFPNLRQIIERAAELKILAAWMFLGEYLRESEPKASFTAYSAAADLGDMSALTTKGVMLANGYGCEKDLNKAVESLRAAAELGAPRAKAALADFYLHGTNVPKDDKKAVELLLEAVDGGDPRAMDQLATCYDQGIGTEVNPDKAFRLYSSAAEAGFNHSLGNLAVLYITGKGGKRPDPLKAINLLQKGGRAGDDFCLYLYARCIESGTGVKADKNMAREMYKKAAEAGSREAQKWCAENHVDFQSPRSPALAQ